MHPLPVLASRTGYVAGPGPLGAELAQPRSVRSWSPRGFSAYLAKECRGLRTSFYLPDVPLGQALMVCALRTWRA